MKKIAIVTITAATLAFGFTGCHKSVSGSEDMRTDLVSFRNIELARSYTYENSAASYDADSDVVVAAKAELLMPVAVLGAQLTELQDSILRRAFEVSEATIENCDSSALVFFNTRLSEHGFELSETVVHPDSIDDFYTRYNGYLSVNINPITLTPRLLTMQTIRGQYEPYAAHGIYSIWYVNFDIARSKILRLDDLVTPEGIAALPKIIRTHARGLIGHLGPVQIDRLPVDCNFYINARNELVFAYQPYEVASYAQGEIRIPIPAYRVAEYLTPLGTDLLF